MKNVLRLTHADDGQNRDKRLYIEKHKPRSKLPGGRTPSTQSGNLAASGLGGGIIMAHLHGASHV